MHDAKRTDDRDGQGKAGDDRGPNVAQEEKDDEHHQAEGDQQRYLNVVNGFLDGVGMKESGRLIILLTNC